MSFLPSFFSPIRTYQRALADIKRFSDGYATLTDEELKKEAENLRQDATSAADIKKLLPQSFALVREVSARVLGQRHYDVQLIGGMVLAQGAIAEMATGEGKTLAATAPAYLYGLTGKGVHIITVNDYLAQRDAVWMGQIYHFLGLSVGCIVHDAAYIYDPTWEVPENTQELIDEERDVTGSFRVQKEYLRPVPRKEAYKTDILYGTNHEFGFDYLRDNLAYSTDQQVQRTHYYALIDEVDSILIDEARTPLIISAPDAEAAQHYALFSRLVRLLQKEEDYIVDEKARSVQITDKGIEKIERALSLDNLYDPSHIRLVHYLDESLKAHALFFRDKNYVVREGQVVIVDEFTGRLMPGRRYSGGLHQALEAKEGVRVQQESKTFAQITIQNYFHLYEKVSGMTGTAVTSAEEFAKVYGLKVLAIPTHRPRIRDDKPDLIFKNNDAKYKALVETIKKKVSRGQPILVGTTSIDENETLSTLFAREGITHEILNAKNHEREGEIIAQAGRPGAVTLATNMAGRGVDIVLGGNPFDEALATKVKEAGGLCVLGTQRHEARRIDNQLRGRSGRQGDPGESQFFLSLDDDMLRIFGGERVKNLMTRLHIPDNEPIESGVIVRILNEAQKKVEGMNFDMRKHLFEYDTVLNRQRQTIYTRRQNLLRRIEAGETPQILEEMFLAVVSSMTDAIPPDADMNEIKKNMKAWLVEIGIARKPEEVSEEVCDTLLDKKIPSMVNDKISEIGKDQIVSQKIIASLDIFWTGHLENLEALLEGVRMRAYGQKDPLVEYKREGFEMFKNLVANAQQWVVSNVFKTPGSSSGVRVETPDATKRGDGNPKVGRNDPCWCGSGKKYKKCHGK